MNEGNNLFYVCSLIEYIGRERKLRRADVVSGLGEETIRRIYRYAVPSYWDIGAVYARLIEDVSDGADPITKLLEVYASWMSDALSRFNSDLFYQSRGYIAECYRAGEILAA